jgi:hypothetical protein
MNELWKPISGYEGYYSVSNRGEVFSVRGQKVLRPGVLPLGYRQVQLMVDGAKQQAKVHRLVAFAFLGEPPTPQHQVAHNNGNPADNRVENLRWATPTENQRDRRAHGTASIGEANRRAKLTADDARAIRASTARNCDLARTYGVSWSQIYSIRSRKTWAHLD